MDPNEEQSKEDPELEQVRGRAYRLILQQAEKAAQEGQMRRFDELLDGIIQRPGAGLAAVVEEQEGRRERRLDIFRIAMAGLLVAGLIAIVIYAIWHDTDVADKFVPLVSGLAGIALGWLYGSSSRRTALEVES